MIFFDTFFLFQYNYPTSLKEINLKAVLEPLTAFDFDLYDTKYFTSSSSSTPRAGSSLPIGAEAGESNIYQSSASTQSDTTIDLTKSAQRVRADVSLHNIKPCGSI